MPHKPAKLTPMEKWVLGHLALKWSYDTICKRTFLKKYPTQNITREYLHVICQHIRQKTGIESTRDWKECDAYMNGSLPLLKHQGKHPTRQQIKVMRLRSQGLSNEETGKQLGLKWDTVMNHCVVGCRRAGIPRFQGHDRERQMRLWLAEYDKAEAETAAYLAKRRKMTYAPGEGPGLLQQVVEQHEAEAEQMESMEKLHAEKPAHLLTMDDF